MRQTFYNTFPLQHKLINSFQQEMKRRNFHDMKLITNWTDIFEDMAEKISPLKISFNGITTSGIRQKILYVSTNDRAFATQFIFHKQFLLDKLNTYFGINKTIFIDIKIKVLD